MTWEKLMDKIDTFDAAGMVREPSIRALRAIVELHYEKSFDEDSLIKNICNACSKIYPCPTIQAIQKELA